MPVPDVTLLIKRVNCISILTPAVSGEGWGRVQSSWAPCETPGSSMEGVHGYLGSLFHPWDTYNESIK